jgi:hypothetical protein
MARWFRSHTAKLDNPKVQRLPDTLYRAWDSLLCVAARYDGVLPELADTAFFLRKPEEETAELIEALVRARLFERTERGIEPHDWDDWQYNSDISTERVKRFRKRPRTVSETLSESDSDSDSDSEAIASGAAAPEPVKELFDDGVKLLTETGCKPRNARSLIGKWRKDHGDAAAQAAIRAARAEQCTEPIAWITRRLAGTQRLAGKPRENWRDRQIREIQQAVRDA